MAAGGDPSSFNIIGKHRTMGVGEKSDMFSLIS